MMEPLTPATAAPAPKTNALAFGLAGLLVAFLGLAMAIFGPLALEVKQPPRKELSDVLADTAVKIRDRLSNREAQPPPPRQTDWRVVAIIAASAIGFIGAAFGTAAWVRREDWRISSAAVVVGVAAIGWHYILAAIGVTIGLVIIGWIYSKFN